MIIGLTGGIGSGKSTVAARFKELGVPVFIADEHARTIMEEDQQVVMAVKDVLGEEVYKNGKPDRALIASRVFSDKDLLNKLNAIIHPAVARRFQQWYSRQNAPYVIYEAAILFEHGGHHKCDKVILVTAPQEVRVNRVVKRDGSSREEVLRRMANQWPEEQKIPLADYVIENIDLAETLRIVKKIHGFYVKN